MGTMARPWNTTANGKIWAETVGKEMKIYDLHQANPPRDETSPPQSKFDLPPVQTTKVGHPNKYSAPPSKCEVHGVFKCSHCFKAPWLPKTEPQLNPVFCERTFGVSAYDTDKQ